MEPDSVVNTVDYQIGERVQRFRMAASLSTQEVADACGLSSEDYEASEAGDRTFDARELIEIAKIVGFSLYDLFGSLKIEL